MRPHFFIKLAQHWLRAKTYMIGKKSQQKTAAPAVLTVQPSKLQDFIPDWWVYSDKLFLAVFGGYIVRNFLMKLRNRKKRRGEKWNFIGWSMEFTKAGYAHWHMLFFGRYILRLLMKFIRCGGFVSLKG